MSEILDYANLPRTKWPAVISRKDAKELKRRRYFTGRACKNGHITTRSVSTAQCPLCQMEPSQIRAFVMRALRKANWAPKYRALDDAFVKRARNPKTNRIGKLYRCSQCGELFGAKDVAIDHIERVVPVAGFDSWDGVIRRMFCSKEGFQVLCVPCHLLKSKGENEEAKRSTPNTGDRAG